MRNYKFKLSNMMPNAWFYKLKEMSSTTHHRTSNNHSMSQYSKKGLQLTASPTTPKHSRAPQQAKFRPNRASCYISSKAETHKLSYSPLHSKLSHSHFPLDSPRKSMKISRRKPYKSPPNNNNNKTSFVSNGCSCRVLKDADFSSEFQSVQSPDTPTNQCDYFIDGEFDSIPSWSSSSSCTVTTSATDIIIDIASKNAKKSEKLEDFDMLQLPPIQTKQVKKYAEQEQEQVKFVDNKFYSYKSFSPVKQQQRKSNAKRSPSGLHRLRMRANSPRIVSKKAGRKNNASVGSKSVAMQIKTKGISDSFAVVKSSLDPERDFRDSMMEMIVENNIRKSKDLEELLACYLSLNSNEYHDVIVEVFQQIWFDLAKKNQIVKCN